VRRRAHRGRPGRVDAGEAGGDAPQAAGAAGAREPTRGAGAARETVHRRELALAAQPPGVVESRRSSCSTAGTRRPVRGSISSAANLIGGVCARSCSPPDHSTASVSGQGAPPHGAV